MRGNTFTNIQWSVCRYSADKTLESLSKRTHKKKAISPRRYNTHLHPGRRNGFKGCQHNLVFIMQSMMHPAMHMNTCNSSAKDYLEIYMAYQRQNTTMQGRLLSNHRAHFQHFPDELLWKESGKTTFRIKASFCSLVQKTIKAEF